MDRLVDWFGQERLQSDMQRVRRFWAGEGRHIVSINTTRHGYRQIFDDAKMAELAVRNLQEQASLPGVNLPAVFADYGTISTARYWGGEVHGGTSEVNIYINPAAQTLDEALALNPRPVDDAAMDAARGVGLFHRVREALRTEHLWLRTPDMQGTLNTAGLVMNQQELMMAMYTEPQKVHALLEKVGAFLVDYARYLRRQTGGRICGNIWPYTFFPADIGVSLTEDLMPLLSAEQYKEFGIPTLRQLQQALGALHIHCCGDWGRHAANLAASGLDIRCAEFHHPAVRIEELEPLADTTVLVPYIILHKQDRFRSNVEYYRYLLSEHGWRFRFWFALCEDSPETREFAQQVGGGE